MRLLFIILIINSCDNAKNKSSKSRMVTENTTLSASCEGNACSVTVLRWNKNKGEPVFKNIDKNRSIVVTIDNDEVSQKFILPPGEESESDLSSFSDPYHSDFK